MAQTKRPESEFKVAYEKFFDMVYKLSFLYVKKTDEAADISQDVFFKYLITNKTFADDEHLKAWLITCTRNACMDYFRSKLRKQVSLEQIEASDPPFEIDETLAALLKLPETYRILLYMHYYEGYPTEEIAKVLHKPGATVRVGLHRGRQKLRALLEGKTARKDKHLS